MTYEEARAARRAMQRAAIDAVHPDYDHVENETPQGPALEPSIEALEAAGREFARRCSMRADSFANRSSEACFDIAAKLRQYGSYASAAQQGYAQKLIGWAAPRESQQVAAGSPCQQVPAGKPVAPAFVNLPALVNLNGFARFTVGKLQLTLKNDGSLIWVKWDGRIAGRIENGQYIESRRYLSAYALSQARTELDRVEADPKGVAMAEGIATGRCSCCSRPLTDPTSISLGIGPVCREKSGWF